MNEIEEKIRDILIKLIDIDNEFLKLEGQKIPALAQYPQKNVDKLIVSIHNDFLLCAIINIQGEFLPHMPTK